jgi:hypothetical protein
MLRDNSKGCILNLSVEPTRNHVFDILKYYKVYLSYNVF